MANDTLTTVIPHAPMFAIAAAAAFTWGVCGHPGQKGTYGNPTEQMEILEKRGLKTYRFDVFLADDRPNSTSEVEALLQAARPYNITLHPILHVPFSWGDATDKGRYPHSHAGLESQGFNRVYPIVKRLANEIQDWELENELTLRKGFKSDAGDQPEDYQTPEAGDWAAVLRGMSKAIKQVQAESGKRLRTVVDIVYIDFGFIPFLAAQDVTVDKVAYHYYYSLDTDPRRIYATPRKSVAEEQTTQKPMQNRILSIFESLAKLRKPIIINELNAAEIYDPKHGKPYNENKALLSLRQHIENILGQKEAPIEGAEFYELYDEPQKDPVEGNFGLMVDGSHPKTQILVAAAYACGTLTKDEQRMLVLTRIFTGAELTARLSVCQSARN